MSVTLADVATRLGLEPRSGDAAVELEGIAPVHRAGPRHLAFVAEAKFLKALQETRAGCVLVREEWRDECPVPTLCVPDPYLAYAQVSSLFDQEPRPVPGVHPSAVVDPTVVVPADAYIGPLACVEAGATLGNAVYIGPGAYVGSRVSLGEWTRIDTGVVLYHDVILGRHCRVHANTVIGADGFGFARKNGGWEKISQLGRVRIGDHVDIGASCTVDRGALDDTIIHDHVIIDDQVHVAHNCELGARTAIAGCVGIAGSVTVGADCTFAGQVGVSGHLDICDNAHFIGQARVPHSITEPGTYASGTGLDKRQRWARNAVRFSQLDALQKRVKQLETQLEKLVTETAAKNPESRS